MARFVPWLRRDVTIHAATATGAAFVGVGTVSARAVVGWVPTATIDEKLDLLDARTLQLDREIGELQAALRAAEKTIRRELTEVADQLRAEAREISEALNAFRRETLRSDASALPVIVIGVVLSGLAPDAAQFQVWFWCLFLAVMCVGAGVVVWRILRQSGGDARAA